MYPNPLVGWLETILFELQSYNIMLLFVIPHRNESVEKGLNYSWLRIRMAQCIFSIGE